jgi:hypothetical protein
LSQLDDYPLTDLDTLTGEPIASVKPGDFVKYSNEPWDTFGILIARVHNASWTGDLAMVLWSQAPRARVSSRSSRVWEEEQ